LSKCKELIRNQKEQLIEKEKHIETHQQELLKYVKMEAEHNLLQETFKNVKLDYEERLMNLSEKNSILINNLEKSDKKCQEAKEQLTQKVNEHKSECQILKTNIDSLSAKLNESQAKNENLTKLNEKVLANLRNKDNEKKEAELKKMNDELVEEKNMLKSNFQKIESELEESLKAATEREKTLVIH
jgi:chromosome segregation ATPase